ncbi:MAG: hypothetical protein ACLFRN_04945 [Halothece sp.]
MTPNPLITQSIEKLDYRVTVGDVATETGLKVQEAQKGLVGLAAEAGGHLQVSETGDITYLFPENFRTILRNKYLRLRLKEWWDKIWGVLFYLIRISFGIVLVASIILMAIAILVIIIGAQMSSDEGDSDNNIGGGGGMSINFFPLWLFGPDLFWFFSPGYYEDDEPIRRERSQRNSRQKSELSFLEAIFSFLFGDGNPNRKLEERRWQEIGRVIQNNGGAVVGEQIAPYLDDIDQKSWEDEDYMLPVLMQFNGVPEVTEDGSIIYYFPDLQVKADRQGKQSVESYLKENYWQFTKASSNQKMLAIGLGGANLVLALMLGSLLSGVTVAQGGFIAFINGIYGILLGYAIGYLVIPLIRYFWIQQQNKKIVTRNEKRSQRAEEFLKLAGSDQSFQNKLQQAQKFASETILSEEDVAYSTEEDLIDQEANRSDKIDEDWKRRLNSDQ